jgi:hypothetical protein
MNVCLRAPDRLMLSFAARPRGISPTPPAPRRAPPLRKLCSVDAVGRPAAPLRHYPLLTKKGDTERSDACNALRRWVQ